MVFNSVEFVFFITLVGFVFYLLNRNANTLKWRNVFLLLASWYFYGSFQWWFLLLLLYIIVVNYYGAIIVAKKLDKPTKVPVTIVIVLSIGILGFMKYAYLWSDSIILPVGLSFFTFQALSYSLDVYRKKIPVERDFVKVALFISFLPTILSGPIERARNILPQFNKKLPINYDNTLSGIRLFTWGIFKKVVIADRLAQYVNEVYMFPDHHTGGTLTLSAIFYSVQIYCDFSGYADMAIGVGRLLGFKIMENFNFPYFSKSIKDFWRRWHISLTSWFTEYVYISLGGNRVCLARWIVNIMVVFLLSGIWHGATTAFIIWGAIHGVAYLVEKALNFKRQNILHALICFVVVTFAWVFFRVEDSSVAVNIIWTIVTDLFSPIQTSINGSTFTFCITISLLLLFAAREFIAYKKKLKTTTFECMVLLLLVSLFGVGSSPFVYFQF